MASTAMIIHSTSQLGWLIDLSDTNGQVEWLKKQIQYLVDLGDQHNDTGPTLDYGPYTLLKLICVAYYAPMFAKIAKGPKARARGYDGAIYLDLFAGPGIIKVTPTSDRIAGSPIAVSRSKYTFDYSVFVEKEVEKSRILRRRLSSFLSEDNFTLIHGDCNTEVRAIVEMIRKRYKRPIVFVFVDPEGMEAKWNTVKTISHEFPNSDFMINVTTGAARVAGRLQAGMLGDKPIFEDFFGEEAENILPRISEGEQVQQTYETAVRTVLGKPVGATISIRQTGERVIYYLLAYTRESLTGSPWAQGFTTLKRQIERFDGDMAQKVLDIVKGRQAEL